MVLDMNIKQFIHSASDKPRLLWAFSLVLSCAAFSFSASIYADINSVTSTPSSFNIALTGSSAVNVKWRVNRTETVATTATARTVSSPASLLQINGLTVASLAGAISQTSTLAVPASETVVFNETLALNMALARRIADSPAGSVSIVRVFTDSQTSATGRAKVFSKSENSGALEVRRIDLAFENKARTDVVYKDESIRAIVDLNFSGSGILRGEWRLIDPSTSLAGTDGRVVQIIQKSLISSGKGRTRIISPPLPTNINGLYFVTFFIHNTNTALEMPILRYFVLDNQASSLTTEPLKIEVLSPIKGNSLTLNTIFLTQNTNFSWLPVQGAQAYQVELFNKDDDVAITGKLVQATELTLSLSALSLQRLYSGYEYNWQVRAFDAAGTIIGQSALQTLIMP